MKYKYKKIEEENKHCTYIIELEIQTESIAWFIDDQVFSLLYDLAPPPPPPPLFRQ